jgi:hypothetical protein
VFWNATDDVDFDEIASIGWHTQDDGLFHLQLPRQDRRTESFIGDLPEAGDHAALAAVQRRLGQKAATRLQIFAATQSGDHGNWVAQMLRQIFPQLLVVDARSAALRRHAAPLFRSYLEQHPAAHQAIETQIEALRQLGHQRILSPASVRMGLFLTEHHTRQKTEDVAILLEQARSHPQRLSPNVTLRPLVQDQLLPSVAAVVGPAELGYHLELQSLRRLLEVPEPALVSRLSGTILPKALWKEVQSHIGDVASWLRSPQDAMQQAGRERAAASIRQAEALWATFDDGLRDLQVDGADDAALQRARRGMQPLRDRLSRDITETFARGLVETAPGLSRAAQLVQPGQRPQERVLAGLWLFARLGASTGEILVQEAREHLRALAAGQDAHALWVVDDESQLAHGA